MPKKKVSLDVTQLDNFIYDMNRCIKCKRCIRSIQDEQGRNIFAYTKRGSKSEVVVDPELGAKMTDELAQKAMDNCPVGSILVKEKGFDTPIGKRKFDTKPIGSEIENTNINK